MADIFSQDSREKLDAEVRKWCGMYAYQADMVWVWLNRQAAITERHWMEIVGASANANVELKRQIDELQAKVDELESLDDGLLDKYLERGEKIAELTEERDLWNKRYSQAYDYASDLQEQLDKLSSDELHWRSEADFWKRKYELICKALIDLNRNYVHVEDEGLA